MLEMHSKLMTSVYNRAQDDIDEQNRKQRQMIRSVLTTLRNLGQIILDESVRDETLRQVLFSQVDREKLASQMAHIETWLTGKYSHVFNLVVQRYTYLRQFAPTLLQHLHFRLQEGTQSTLVAAIQLLRDLNQENKRKLPEDAPLDFIPKSLRSLVEKDGEVNRSAWECALLTAVRDEIRAGNIYVTHSKRFGRFDDFLAQLQKVCNWGIIYG